MPPKNCELGTGTLYLDGSPIGEIQEASFEREESRVSDLAASFKKLGEVTLTATTRLRRLTFLSLIHGRKVTNNWLKMHGGVMTRRWIK